MAERCQISLSGHLSLFALNDRVTLVEESQQPRSLICTAARTTAAPPCDPSLYLGLEARPASPSLGRSCPPAASCSAPRSACTRRASGSSPRAGNRRDGLVRCRKNRGNQIGKGTTHSGAASGRKKHRMNFPFKGCSNFTEFALGVQVKEALNPKHKENSLEIN